MVIGIISRESKKFVGMVRKCIENNDKTNNDNNERIRQFEDLYSQFL